jgi:protoheme IX farnesyltransferase
MGLVFWVVDLAAGVLYIAYAVLLRRDGGTVKAAMRLFTYSITYITVIFAAMALDVFVHVH